MAESTLTSTFEDIQVVAGLEMGWGRSPKDWTTTNDTDFGIACKEGYRQFLYPVALPGENKSHNWSFLYPLGTITLGETYTTGTMTVISYSGDGGQTYAVTTVEGNGTTFPTWVAQNYITYTYLATEYSRIIKTRESSTLLTLENDDTTVDISTAAGLTYSIANRYVLLPDDFGGMVSDSFTYRRDEQWHLPQIKIVGEAEIRKVDRANNGEVYPRWASLNPIAPSAPVNTAAYSLGGHSTRWLVTFYPRPEQSYELEYRYHAIPPALDASTNIYHYGGAEHSQTIIASVVDALYRRVRSSNEKREEFLGRMKQSILHDRRNYQTGNLGQKLRYAESRDALREFRENTPTGNITTTFY